MKPSIFTSKLIKSIAVSGAVIIIVLISILRSVAGPEIDFTLAYMFPIALVIWFTGRWQGYITVALCSLSWLFSELGIPDSSTVTRLIYINLFSKTIVMMIFAVLFSNLKKISIQRIKFARIDSLTNVYNKKAFLQFAGRDLAIAGSYGASISLIYIDLDDFKNINDSFGHMTGDQLLNSVADIINRNVREKDLVARLGGDEFGVLLIATDESSSNYIAEQIKDKLDELMTANKLKVTFSIGLAIFKKAPDSVDLVIQKAENLMYTAKKTGKNKMIRDVY